MSTIATLEMDLEEAYRRCIRCARSAAGNFYYGFFGLDAERFRAICALYSFLRVSDDLVDDGRLSVGERSRRFAAWREIWEAACDGRLEDVVARGLHACVAQDPGDADDGQLRQAYAAVYALSDAVRRFCIPPGYVADVLDGLAWDLRVDSKGDADACGAADASGQPGRSDRSPRCLFQSFHELQRYCYHVAGAVGVCCIHIWGFKARQAESAAIDCGTAFQLTNILRDIGEDARRGRVYLPREDLERFGVDGVMLSSGRGRPELRELLRFEVSRAESFFARSEPLREYLDGAGRAAFRAMFELYHRLLQRVARLGESVLERRAAVPVWRKCWIAGRSIAEARAASWITRLAGRGELLAARPGAKNASDEPADG